MNTINGQITSTWQWLNADPRRVQLALLAAASLALVALTLLAGAHPIPFAGLAGGGSGGSG